MNAKKWRRERKEVVSAVSYLEGVGEIWWKTAVYERRNKQNYTQD